MLLKHYWHNSMTFLKLLWNDAYHEKRYTNIPVYIWTDCDVKHSHLGEILVEMLKVRLQVALYCTFPSGKLSILPFFGSQHKLCNTSALKRAAEAAVNHYCMQSLLNGDERTRWPIAQWPTELQRFQDACISCWITKICLLRIFIKHCKPRDLLRLKEVTSTTQLSTQTLGHALHW